MTSPPGPRGPQVAEDDAELLEVFDEQGRVLGLRRRGEIHGDPALIHRAVHVLVSGQDGRLFLQQRAAAKRIQPDKWDTSVGGHVDPGEGYLTAAVRELAEELGVVCQPGLLRHLHDYLWRTEVESEQVRTYALTCDGPFELHPAELQGGRFWSDDELRATAGSGIFTPNLEHELQLVGII